MSEIVTNLHDVNKMVISQLKEIDKSRKEELVDKINQMDDGLGRRYFMLLSNEKRDYTVFNLCKGKEEALGKEVFEVLDNRGKIKEYDVKYENDRIIAIEIWIDDAFYALFPYDLGVVEC